jgi:biofilm PGA synthesis N-glycosyltransferase PgaC
MSHTITYTPRQPVSKLRQPVDPIMHRREETYESRGVSSQEIHPLPPRIAKRSLKSRILSEKVPRHKLALLLPGHNEELIVATTIRSAVAAGQPIEDIYVVDDNSSDNTRIEALKLLPESQVLTVERSGKAVAVQKSIKHFKIVKRYEWLHVADADSVFSQDYFNIYRSKLDKENCVVAVGFVQSMRGNWISTYRAVEYTYSQQVNRRIQSYLDMISVFPGPITSFRTDILDKLDFGAKTITEDFDVTLQVHRKKLGRVAYIPKAVNYTQDPQTLKDFWRQNMRWQRGFWQCVLKYRIGLRPQRIDVSLGFQMLQTIVFLFQLAIVWPLLLLYTHHWMAIVVAVSADVILNGLIALWSSVITKRWMLIGMLPYFYFLRWVEISAYLVGFFEVVVLRKFKDEVRGWATEGRRYKLTLEALQDTA